MFVKAAKLRFKSSTEAATMSAHDYTTKISGSISLFMQELPSLPPSLYTLYSTY